MASKPVAFLLADLGVTKTHSRPHCSNDNPYSESQFKTLKYRPEFPEKFGSIEDARAFCSKFYRWYNTVHRHSGIGMHTPIDVHHGYASRSGTTAPASSRRPIWPTPSGSSATTQSRRHCPPQPGSTRPTRTRRPRQQTRRRSSASDPKRLGQVPQVKK